MFKWLRAQVLEYPSVSQYPFCLVSSGLLHRSPRMCISSCTLLPLLYSIPFSYFPNSPFRTRWRYHHMGHTATMGACYSQLPVFPISFPPSFVTLSHLWFRMNKDFGRHSHISINTPGRKNVSWTWHTTHNVCKDQVLALNTTHISLLSKRQESCTAPHYTGFYHKIPCLSKCYATSQWTHVNLIDLHCTY